MSDEGEHLTETDHPKIMRFVSEPPDLAKVRESLAELTRQMHHAEPNQLKLLLKKAVPEYQPYLT